MRSTHDYLQRRSAERRRQTAIDFTGHAAAARSDGDALAAAPSLEDLTWALSIAWSRGHTVSMESVRGLGATRRPGLVPIGDLFNHAPEAEATVETISDPAAGAFSFVASRPMPVGAEALISYSLHAEPSNSKLLLDYGFCAVSYTHLTLPTILRV